MPRRMRTSKRRRLPPELVTRAVFGRYATPSHLDAPPRCACGSCEQARAVREWDRDYAEGWYAAFLPAFPELHRGARPDYEAPDPPWL
jgi:hypothetical protein